MNKTKNESMISMKNAVLAAMAIMTMSACGSKEAPAEKTPIVDVVTVKDKNDVSTTTFTGRTKAASEVNLAFRVAGQIERLLVNEGDFVRKGQVVAVMDRRDYEVQLAATQAEYEQIKADAERVMLQAIMTRLGMDCSKSLRNWLTTRINWPTRNCAAQLTVMCRRSITKQEKR